MWRIARPAFAGLIGLGLATLSGQRLGHEPDARTAADAPVAAHTGQLNRATPARNAVAVRGTVDITADVMISRTGLNLFPAAGYLRAWEKFAALRALPSP